MTTNTADLEWVPVTQDGAETKASLRTALAQAHEIQGLGAGLLPVEREALLRLLESLAAAVLHGMDPDDLAAAERIPEDAVTRFFAEHDHLFDLADPDRPFLQEWHTPPPDSGELDSKRYRPVRELHLRVPGASSAAWGVTDEPRDASDKRILALLLTAAWFHGKPSNAGGADFYRPTSGDKRSPISGSPSGGPRDTVFHLIGKTLAQTLLMDIPRDWLQSEFPPAWLDQDADPPPSYCALPGTLWRCTWTANRAKAVWEGGRPTLFTSGLTQRRIPPVGDLDGRKAQAEIWKANAKAAARGDYCRPLLKDPKKPGAARPVLAPAGLGTAEGYEKWYQGELSTALNQWADGIPRIVEPPRDALVGFHNEEGDTYGNRHWSTWEAVPLAYLAIVDPQALLALKTVTAYAKTLADAVFGALEAEFPEDKDKKKRPLANAVRRSVYASLDEPVLAAVADASAGKAVDDRGIRADMARRAARAFCDATDPIMSPSSCAAVYRARAAYSRAARSKGNT